MDYASLAADQIIDIHEREVDAVNKHLAPPRLLTRDTVRYWIDQACQHRDDEGQPMTLPSTRTPMAVALADEPEKVTPMPTKRTPRRTRPSKEDDVAEAAR